MERAARTTAILATLAMIAAVTIPMTATAKVEPRPRDTFAALNDVDGTHLYDTAQHETQKAQARQVAEQLAQMRDAAALAAQEAAYAEWTDAEPTYSAEASYAPSDGLTKAGGVNYHDGRTETYYSSAVLTHKDIGQWTADSEGFYRDSEGRYVVAASDMPQGTVFQGSKGECIVLDCGCADGVTDYYVDGRWA